MKCISVFFLLFLLPLILFSKERFPQPSCMEIQESSNSVFERGKEEIDALSINVLSQFLWDRYLWGPKKDFFYYGCNPSWVSKCQSKCPATNSYSFQSI